MHTTAHLCLSTRRRQPNAFTAGLSSMLELGHLSDSALRDGIMHCGKGWCLGQHDLSAGSSSLNYMKGHVIL